MQQTIKHFKAQTQSRSLPSDTVTPVSIYLRLRDRFADSILLESSDYHAKENSFSYICCLPVAHFQVAGTQMQRQFPDGEREIQNIGEQTDVPAELDTFIKCFEQADRNDAVSNKTNFVTNGMFGYCAYDAVRHFEDIDINGYPNANRQIPDICYRAYQIVIAINHFNNQLHVFEHRYSAQSPSLLNEVLSLIRNQNVPAFGFAAKEDETPNMSDEEFLDMVEKGRNHCKRGDVFQIVLSRRYTQTFEGDEFNVYRALRSINPSPYLFYFDYGSFKIFGSSPEAQLVIQSNKASIHPIAGTYARTGNDKHDAKAARELFADPKESAEHVMLVDLARNDLSRNGTDVSVDVFKEIQYYSHVIHLVSKVTAKLSEKVSSLRLVADTFPAGTLSGAPKHRAMQLINQYEKTNRGYYGGCIGYIGFNGNFNQAIMIRSFLSKSNQLHYQSGAGIVYKSVSQNELNEVHNKLRALRLAIQRAEENY